MTVYVPGDKLDTLEFVPKLLFHLNVYGLTPPFAVAEADPLLLAAILGSFLEIATDNADEGCDTEVETVTEQLLASFTITE